MRLADKKVDNITKKYWDFTEIVQEKCSEGASAENSQFKKTF